MKNFPLVVYILRECSDHYFETGHENLWKVLDFILKDTHEELFVCIQKINCFLDNTRPEFLQSITTCPATSHSRDCNMAFIGDKYHKLVF